jgi:HNH endonuclease
MKLPPHLRVHKCAYEECTELLRPRAKYCLFHRLLTHFVRNPFTECWIWQGSLRGGYGECAEGLVHRVSYELFVGPVPDGLCVLHTCDTPTCYNPDHLFVGTRVDNVHDMIAKGRAAYPAMIAKLHAEKLPDGRSKHAVMLGTKYGYKPGVGPWGK